MRKKKYGIILDTETTGGFGSPLIYDIAWCIIDCKGNLVKRGLDTVNKDILLKEKKRMMTAYYSEKIPQYLYDLYTGKRSLNNFYNIRQILMKDIRDYGVKFLLAHNANFDRRALNSTMKFITNGKYQNFLPKDIEDNIQWWDTLKMSKSILPHKKKYLNFCTENGFLTKTGRIQYTAEAIYSFIENDPLFKESHTAMKDVECEMKIFEYLVKQKKKMNRIL